MESTEKIRVCLVEDDDLFIDAVKSALGRDPGVILEVERVESEEQLADLPETIMRGDYHVLLVDLGLPSEFPLEERWRAGLCLLEELDNRSCRAIPVVLTGYDQQENYVEVARRGARTLIAKKGERMWDILPVQIRAAYAFWLLQEEKRRSEQRLKNMAARLVHDLNGPLTVFKGYVDLMRLGPELLGEDEFAAVDQAVLDAVSIEDFLLDMLRGTARPPAPQNTDWAGLFGQMARMGSLMAKHFGGVGTVSFENSFSGTAQIDEKLVRRAINNLVINSLAAMHSRAMPEGSGLVDVTSSCDGKWLSLTVNDNAGGISRGDLNKSGSLGIGICRQIVEEVHNGEMPDPVPNDIGGTTFVLRFPILEG